MSATNTADKKFVADEFVLFQLVARTSSKYETEAMTAPASRDHHIYIEHPMPDCKLPEQLLLCKLRVGKGRVGWGGVEVGA